LALGTAHDAGAESLAGNSWSLMSYLEVSEGRSGVDMASTACRVAGPRAPARVRSLLLGRLAWAHANVQQPTEAEVALARAAEALEQEVNMDSPDWAAWVDSREIKIMTGRCWAELHRPMRSVVALEDALVDFADSHARDKSLYLSWLAEAYLEVGEVEQCANAIGRAIDLSVDVGSVRPRQRIGSFAKRLLPYRKNGSVALVLERMGGS